MKKILIITGLALAIWGRVSYRKTATACIPSSCFGSGNGGFASMCTADCGGARSYTSVYIFGGLSAVFLLVALIAPRNGTKA
ncbi:MAG: hypothetical protein WCT32_05865 [Patescibacteria group bacterium]|jgi:hypothetical protein